MLVILFCAFAFDGVDPLVGVVGSNDEGDSLVVLELNAFVSVSFAGDDVAVATIDG